MLNKGGNLIAGKQFTDLTKASALKDTNIIAVHDGNGLKKASMEDVTMYMADKFSNPNLLINPDFKINQRGQATYEVSSAGQIYSVDRWRFGRGKVTVNSDGTVTVSKCFMFGFDSISFLIFNILMVRSRRICPCSQAFRH